MKKFNTLNLSI